MRWLRNLGVYLLSLVLLIALLGLAASTATNFAFRTPAKLEAWLNQSTIYSSIPATVTQEIPNDASLFVDGQQFTATVDSTTIQHAAESSLTPQVLQSSAQTFLNANYAWLKGKTATPQFTINLMGPATQFSQSIGQYIQTHLASLPPCSQLQLFQLRQQDFTNLNITSVTCLPPTINPQEIADQAGQFFASGNEYLSNPSVTQDSIKSGTPYYRQLHWLPSLYQLGIKLPWITGSIAILCAVGLFFTASTRRRGLRRLGWVLLEAGIILLILKLITSFIFNKLNDGSLDFGTSGQLQQSVVSFSRQIFSYLTTIELRFGIGYLILAVFLGVALFFTRNRARKLPTEVPLSPVLPTPATTSTGTTPPTLVQ